MRKMRRPLLRGLFRNISQPVNIDTFALDDVAVARDMEIRSRWNVISSELAELRGAANYQALLEKAKVGLEYLKEIDPMDAPVHCEINLLLESAQAAYNLNELDFSYSLTQQVLEKIHRIPRGEPLKLYQTLELQGLVQLKQGKSNEAEASYNSVLEWIDVTSKREMPMVAVAAQDMRRSVLLGKGLVLEQKGVASGDVTYYSKALDCLVASLNAHVEENDIKSVKLSLLAVLRCFDCLNDKEQAMSACEKYIGWCNKHSDSEGASVGKIKLEELKSKYL